ncbi:hypothetical protein [Acinetobacter sp.]|uniref:hypothetical protein n=1 Tax=Acinetobacter sp. TaxID=472 RepID=UPI00388E99B2
MSAFIAKFYEAIIITLMAFLLAAVLFGGFKAWQAKHYKTQLDHAELKCKQEKDAIHTKYQSEATAAEKAYQEALLQKQQTINQLSADYEQAKADRKTEVEYITRTVQKIVDRPVYINSCADVDGMSELNSLIKSRSPS